MSEPLPEKLPAGLAIASLVCGLVSVVLFCLWFIAIPCAIAGLILGVVALVKVSNGKGGGKGMAITGLISSAVAILLAIAAIVGAVAFMGMAKKKVEQSQREAEQRQLEQQKAQEELDNGGPATPAPEPEPVK